MTRSLPTPSQRRRAAAGACLAAALLLAVGAGAQPAQEPPPNGPLVTLDFADAEIADVIETIARATNRNFIYDDRVRGRVTIVSPEPIPVEQAYAVFESVLQVKGFTTVETPGGAIKVVPVREAKESAIETVQSSRRPPDRDRFVTRLIPLNYIDAESIVNTLKPLVSKDAAMAAYSPTNTVILTESASNIRRLIAILESIDVETYKEELAVINVEYADAATLAEQVSEIYGAEVSDPTGAATRRAARRRVGQQDPASTGNTPPVRILTDERTNSLLVLAPRQQLEEVRRLVAKLDVPVRGGGRIHVYYLNNANAEEMAETLGGLLGGGPTGGAAATAQNIAGTGQVAQAIRTTVTGLAGGISVTADPATNSLIIQASQEGFAAIAEVIRQLDVERPQVSVEALIMELTVNDGQNLGFSGLLNVINGDTNFLVATATSAVAGGVPILALAEPALAPLTGQYVRDTRDTDSEGNRTGSGSVIDAIINLSANNGDINIVSAPHILTSDNEQAEIRVGDNIPIISSRVESAAGIDTAGLSTSVNVERQDIGVTLRVTPQITEGDSLRLAIFQEITEINSSLQEGVGNQADVGVALSNRRIENTVVVRDGETVVIGGLLSDTVSDSETKAPWLGDIPVLGWLFKSTQESVRKTNLLVFLTPRIVRTPIDLEHETIRRREEFIGRSGGGLELSEDELEAEVVRKAEADAEGRPYTPQDRGKPIRERLAAQRMRYPTARLPEIERTRAERRAAAAAAADQEGPHYVLQAAVLGDPDAAAALLRDLIDSGHDGTLLASQVGDSVLYEIRLGPFATLREAEMIGQSVRRSHGLAPSVLVEEPPDDGQERE